MKKGFRWIPALVILILTMLFSAAAMAESSGEEEKVRDTVEKLCSGIQNYDAQQISSCLKNPSSLTYVSEENAPYVNRFIRENNKQMFRYTVRELSVNGEKAAVVLEIRYPNACDIFQKAMDQLFLYSMSKPEVKTEKALMYRFATMAVTLFFWLPIDILSFINWTKHKDEQEDESDSERRVPQGGAEF